MTTKTMAGGTSQRSMRFLTPTADRAGLSRCVRGLANSAPVRMPTSENATRITPCLKPSPAAEAKSKTANNQIVMAMD